MRTVAIALVIFAVVMHLIAYAMVSRYAGLAAHPDKTALVVVTGSVLLSLSLMLSQAIESVTRAFYARSDLDLLLSSPAPAQKIFAVRIATIALTVIGMAALLAGPFINVLAFTDGAHWLTAYGAIASLGLPPGLWRRRSGWPARLRRKVAFSASASAARRNACAAGERLSSSAAPTVRPARAARAFAPAARR